MYSFDIILKRLENRPQADLVAISEQSGVPFHTLLKIASGETKNPRVRTVEQLQRYFERAAA